MFRLSNSTIKPAELSVAMVDSRAGAFVSFEGWVRNHNDGKLVTALEYEAYEVLCEKEAATIFGEARERFDVIDITCVHRIGKLEIGDCAVWIGVTSAHRDAAFTACRYVIDEIKARLPIWKRESYETGASTWVNCQACTAASHGHQTARVGT